MESKDLNYTTNMRGDVVKSDLGKEFISATKRIKFLLMKRTTDENDKNVRVL